MNRQGYRLNHRRFQTSKFLRLPHCIPMQRMHSVLAVIGLIWLLMGSVPRATSADSPKSNTIYHPSHGFKIPFDIEPADKAILKSIELYVSDDKGGSWRLSSSTNPSSKAFTFRAARDGEYWFAVRTLDVDGRYNPSDDKPILPDWRVVVDTKKPGLGLESVSRRGSTATIHWDARDEYLDLGSLVLEFSIPGSGEWKPIPMGRPTPSGEASWDTGTAESIRVRATVADKAGNVQHAETEMSDGTAQLPITAGTRPDSMNGQAPAPIAQMASNGYSRGILGPHQGIEPKAKSESGNWIDTPSGFGNGPGGRAPRGEDPVRSPQTGSRSSVAKEGTNQPIAASGVSADRRQTPLISSPKFPLNYKVDDAGPNGPALVELWVTRDAGKNWSRWAEDSDRTSPMDVDLGGEGVFGVSIIARSIAGQGDEIPRSGTTPQMWVEVDSTPPAMILNVIKVGVGSQSGKVLISWQAEDRNFGPRPISLYYRPETGTQWMPIVEAVENTGQYVWTPGPQVPPVFHVRVEARDEAGNRAGVDTTEYEPVLLDRSRPKARILGLNSAPAEPPATREKVQYEDRPKASIVPPAAAIEAPPEAAPAVLQQAPATPDPAPAPVPTPVVANPSKAPEPPETKKPAIEKQAAPRVEPVKPTVPNPPVTQDQPKAPESLKPPIQEKLESDMSLPPVISPAPEVGSPKDKPPETPKATGLTLDLFPEKRPLDAAPPIDEIPIPERPVEAPPKLQDSP